MIKKLHITTLALWVKCRAKLRAQDAHGRYLQPGSGNFVYLPPTSIIVHTYFLILGSMMGPPPPLMGMQTSGPPNNRFNPRQPGPSNLPNTSGPPPSMGGPKRGTQPVPPKSMGSGSMSSTAMKEQQAKQRAELIAHAQSFLNPSATKKDEIKADTTSTTTVTTKADTSTNDNKMTTTTINTPVDTTNVSDSQ